ncbi:hypothetical protein FUA23_08785 [Neolewinella aurantiaca]|uniref:Uncharacterized protein n=1 Tax=Neolewinella aurantiaca TaxID=2602767 RepID=A0A5C7FIY0_9BACT|nr:hypothetical protein [Neolewinella aurantiaca]TXF89773.1 hypothetical protein FUA23_08785 [Neolewinella aurantiaca]
MNIFALKGHRVRAVDPLPPPSNGWPTIDPQGLTAGELYTVECTEVHSYNTVVSLQEISDRSYNSVLFEDVDEQSEEDDAKHPYHQRDEEDY